MTDRRELWQLLAAPISAVNEAETANAMRFVELFTECACTVAGGSDGPQPLHGKDNHPGTHPQRLRELMFEVEGRDQSGAPERRLLRIPLFQLMPISGVSIERAKLSYTLEVGTAPPDNGVGQVGDNMPRLVASIARRTGSTEGDVRRAPTGSGAEGGNLEVEIELRQMDLPAGVLELLQHTQGAAIEVLPYDAASDDRSGRPLDDCNHEEPWSPDELFRVSIRSPGDRPLPPGQELVTRANIRLNRALTRGEPVQFELAAYPKGSLQVISPGQQFTIDSDRHIPLRVAVAGRVGDYRPGAIVGLRVAGAIGSEVRQSRFVRLPHAPPDDP